jgi:hypothetical protein
MKKEMENIMANEIQCFNPTYQKFCPRVLKEDGVSSDLEFAEEGQFQWTRDVVHTTFPVQRSTVLLAPCIVGLSV